MTPIILRRVAFVGLGLALGCAGAMGPGGPLSRSIEFESADGATLFRMEPEGSAVRVTDARGDTLVVLRIEDSRVAILDRHGSPVGSVEPPSASRSSFRLSSQRPAPGVWDLRRERDGDLELEDGQDRTIYEIKLREYGFKIVDGEGRLESKIRLRDGKISVRDEASVTYMSTRDAIPPQAAAVLSLRNLRFEHAAGLSVAMLHWGIDG